MHFHDSLRKQIGKYILQMKEAREKDRTLDHKAFY